MSLKTKLIVASCGPLVILLVVALMGIQTISQSSRTLEKIFRENYDSVAAGIAMQHAIQQIDRVAESHAWGDGIDKDRLDAEILQFAKNLKFQQGNITVPGEKEATGRLAESWNSYGSGLETFLKMDTPDSRTEYYRNVLLPRSDQVQDAAQQIINLNLNNMAATDGQAQQQARETNRTIVVLVVSGVFLALLFAAILGPWIVLRISRLTKSVQEIKEGNLDLVVKVRSKDEIGQLGAAFNEMASSLRELRRTNRARFLRTQKATLSVLNSLSDAVVILSPAGAVELSNKAAEAIFGLRPGLTIQAVGNEKVTELFERAVRERRPIRHKSYDSAIQKFQDGVERFFLPEAVPIIDDERQLAGITLVFTDITSLRQIDEAKSSLISTVSHELKTPLTSMRLATHALLSEKLGPLTPKQAEIVSAARDESDRLYRIIENLLDIGQMESGRTRMELRPMNTDQILSNAVEEMRTAFIDRGVTLTLDLPGYIPLVLADRFRLEIVFANLLNNALKYTPPGGQVRISARPDNDVVRFTVEDTGSGIPEEYLPHIFEKFFRVPGYEHQKDSGLGLSIVKEIIDAHRGEIRVESKPGEGAKFTFTLHVASPVSEPRAM